MAVRVVTDVWFAQSMSRSQGFSQSLAVQRQSYSLLVLVLTGETVLSSTSTGETPEYEYDQKTLQLRNARLLEFKF